MIMKRFIVALFIMMVTSVSAQESVLLRANYTKGDKYEITIEQTQNMGLQGGVNMTLTLDMTVTDVYKDSLISEAKITSVKMDMMDQSGTDIAYDSSQPSSELGEGAKMMKAQLDPMLNTLLITTMTKRGKNLGVVVDPPNTMMSQFVNNSNGIIFPEEKVSVGSTWENENKNMGLVLTQVYKVTKIENGTMYVDISGSVSGKGQGDVIGRTEIDIESGIQKMLENSVRVSAFGAEVTVSSKVTTIRK